MKKFIAAIVYSNLWISVGAFSFCMLFYLLNGLELDFYYLFFVFFSTLLTYTFQRFMKLYYSEKISGPRMEWMKARPLTIKVILFLGLIGTLTFCLFLDIISISILFFLGSISFLYAFKFNLTDRRTNLRDIPGIKIYLISFVWALSCSIIPAIESKVIDLEVIYTCLGFFLFVLGITIPFDIRDIDYDEVNKKTIPQLVGVDWAKMIAVVLLVGSYFLMSYPNVFYFGLLIGSILSILLVSLTTKNRDELYFSFVLDGLLVLVPLIVYLDQMV